MTQRVLSLWMKVIIILFAVCGIAIFFVAVPFIGNDFAKGYPEYAYCFLPWLVFIDLMAIPCYIVLGYAWRVAQSILKEEAFTKKNSQRLKSVSVLSLVTSIYFFIGNMVFLLLSMNHPSIFVLSCICIFIGVSIAVASAVLSYLVNKASDLQEQSDLTI